MRGTKKDVSKMVAVKLPVALLSELDEVAIKRGDCGRSAVIRQNIQEHLTRHRQQFSESAETATH